MSRSLPHDVTLDILSRLPVRSLVRFRCVCNLWNSLFHDSHFVSKQLSYASNQPATFLGCSYEEEIGFYSFEIEAGKLVPSNKFIVPVKSQPYYRMSNTCNGLIAFWGGGYTYVANLSTREWVALPLASPLVSKCRIQCLDSTVGFGFCMATSKYKVVRFITDAEDRWFGEVVTVGTDRSWRSLGEMPHPIPDFVPVYTNGYILWIIGTGWVNGYFCVGGHDLILSFDVSREKFATTELPPCHPEPYGGHREFFMRIWERSACLVDWRVHLDDERSCYLPVMHFHVLESSMWTHKCSVRLRPVEKSPVKYRNAGCLRMSPVIIRDGKALIYCPYESWMLQDVHTEACSMIKLPPLQNLGNRSTPFACAMSIAPVNRLPDETTSDA